MKTCNKPGTGLQNIHMACYYLTGRERGKKLQYKTRGHISLHWT